MSNATLSKSISFSLSPSLRKPKFLPLNKGGQLYSDSSSFALHENKLNTSEFVHKEKLIKIQNPIQKIVKIASRQKFSTQNLKNLSLNSSIQESEKKNSAQKVNIESILLEKLKNESNFEKKFEIIIKTVEKLTSIDRNFSIFYSVIKNFFSEYKQNVIDRCEHLEKFEEAEKNYGSLKENYEKLYQEYLILNKEYEENKAELEKMREENGSMKFKIKRNAAFLNKLKENGVPVEDMYKDLYGNTSKSKSFNKIKVKEKDMDYAKRPSTIPDKNVVPKLNINSGIVEGYQDEFMSKFNEFSESWRKQIIKDHNFVSK